ncbi:MAG TPA: ABC transporter permease [Cyclobacteriaceae bacterium]|nr:ABC transporter permease [Cyclobacteriaceae bacterium]
MEHYSSKTGQPPKYFLRFFRWFCHPDLKNYIEGDLMELYYERQEKSGKRKADIKFIIDVLLLFRPGIIKPENSITVQNPFDMFRNYFKISIRNILKYKAFSFINIFGLAVAMSVCMLIILMLADQNRYDAFHLKKDRIFRILSDTENSRNDYATSPFPLAAAFTERYPEVEVCTHLTPGISGEVAYHQKLTEIRGYFAEPQFFNIFSFDLEEGNNRTALQLPRSMVISREIAERIFGSENPVGKILDFSDREPEIRAEKDTAGDGSVPWGSFTVTGVIDMAKYKSHLEFDVLVSESTLPSLYAEKKFPDRTNDWTYYWRTYTYVLAIKGKTGKDLDLALEDLANDQYAHLENEDTKGFTMRAQPLKNIQMGLYNNDTNNRLPGVGYYFLSILAIIIMFSACLNYINLSIARALTRVKEIGVRKITGANRTALIYQFMSESVITALFALVLATGILFLLREGFLRLWLNQFLNFELPDSPQVYLVFTGFAILIGLLAGFYPAIYMSRHQPIRALTHSVHVREGMPRMRKVLNVMQFVISLFFIVTSILVGKQFRHFMKFDYGFESKNIINVELQGYDYEKAVNELKSVPGVTLVSASDVIPAGGTSNGTSLRTMGSNEEYKEFRLLNADENFMPNLGIPLVAGRNLPDDTGLKSSYVLVNKAAVHELGYKDPEQIIGIVLESKWDSDPMEVIGVVNDFRYDMPINRDEIRPLVVCYHPTNFQYLNIKISPGNTMTTIGAMEEKWNDIDPGHPLRYEFYDDQLASTTHGILDVISILSFVSFLAITIACLGLLGMANYTVERRSREVAIRKVLGALDLSIAMLLSREFIKILVIAVFLGAPLSYFVNNFWLQKFPNRVEFGIGKVLAGTLIIILLGLLTIVTQTLRASRQNPVENLKSE